MMGSFIGEDLSVIVSDSDEFSSFEIEESVIIDDSESPKSSDAKNVTNRRSTTASDDRNNEISTFNQRSSTQPINLSFSTRNYRSPVKDSSKNLTAESDAIILSSGDEEDDSQTESDSLGSEAAKSNNSLESTGSSIDETSKYKEVTKAVYDAHVAKIGEISERINQYESLLKLSSQLPDKGAKLKQLVVKLKSDLADQKNILQNLTIKEPSELVLDFQNLSINESEKEKEKEPERAGELSYGDCDSVKSLFDEIKRSEKSMPNKMDLADQPRLIKGNLMPHQQQALAWMIWRENQYPKGGILGDDMGLGKTLTMISLIARHIEMRDSKSQEKGDAKPKQDESDLNGRTLVVCPASVIRQWEAEINKFTDHGISVCLHHGDKRSVSAKELTLHEVVITTYGIVRTEIEKNGVLAQIDWERIVLDEAHSIRNYTSKQSLSCCRLNGKRKWALTGTPIQNKHGDVFALVKFLQCSPLNDFCMWKRWTTNKPEQRISYLLKFFLLRRTKDELGKIGQISSLPQKTLQIVQVQLSADELKVYETVSSFSKILSEKFLHQRNPNHDIQRSKNDQCREEIQKALDFFTISGTVSTSHILLVILRLRQICIHPNLIDAMLMEEDINDISGESNLLQELNELTIGGKNDDQKLHRSNPVFDAQRPSSKFDSVLHVIRTKVIQRQEKAVVVSQFTSVLKLFENHLTNQQIKYLVLNGSTKISHRQDIVQSFNDDPDKQILLLSLTAGGVGLNLCGANNLFFIDPHWNPQLESQAEDRVYRIGQTKPVTIYRFICEGTIEERIQKLQERKKGVAKNILSGYKLNIDDMMALI